MQDDGNYRLRESGEIADLIGATSVNFLPVSGLKEVYKEVYGDENVACMHCMGEMHPLQEIAQSHISPIILYDAAGNKYEPTAAD